MMVSTILYKRMMTTKRCMFESWLWGSVTAAFTVATVLVLADTFWLWIANAHHLLTALHASIDPLMLAFLFAELAHTARVMQSTHHIRPELIITLASLASVRHLLVLLTVEGHPNFQQIWESGVLTAVFVIIWMIAAYVTARLPQSASHSSGTPEP